ncbi:hypothetical protein TNCV_2673011 [Trichonephila clavipes]|nr:hypothetical protein TNCV_2673011 [Trichonephila clavipes]
MMEDRYHPGNLNTFPKGNIPIQYQMRDPLSDAMAVGDKGSAGLVLDVKNAWWYFWDNPTHKYLFGEELDTTSIAEKMSNNTFQLREREGESLTSVQKEKLNLLLKSFQNVFEPGGEATTMLELHINMGNRPPISVPIIFFVNVAVHQRSHRLLVPRQDAVGTRGEDVTNRYIYYLFL